MERGGFEPLDPRIERAYRLAGSVYGDLPENPWFADEYIEGHALSQSSIKKLAEIRRATSFILAAQPNSTKSLVIQDIYESVEMGNVPTFFEAGYDHFFAYKPYPLTQQEAEGIPKAYSSIILVHEEVIEEAKKKFFAAGREKQRGIAITINMGAKSDPSFLESFLPSPERLKDLGIGRAILLRDRPDEDSNAMMIAVEDQPNVRKRDLEEGSQTPMTLEGVLFDYKSNKIWVEVFGVEQRPSKSNVRRNIIGDALDKSVDEEES